MQAVGLELVHETDTAALVPTHVQHDTAFARDCAQGLVELWTALTLERPEGLTGEAFAVHSNEGAVLGRFARDYGDVVRTSHSVAVPAEREKPELGGNGRFNFEMNALLVEVLELGSHNAVFVNPRHKRGNGCHGNVCLAAECHEFGHAHHLTRVVDDLGDDGGRTKPGEAHEVDCGLGVPGTLVNAPIHCPKRKNVSRANQVVRGRLRVCEHVERARAVGRANARCDAVARVDGHRVCRSARVFVALDHDWQIQAIGDVSRHRRTEQARRIADDPPHPLGCREFGRHDGVTFVLTSFVVGNEHGLAGAQCVEHLGHGGQFDVGLAHERPPCVWAV